MSTPSDLVRDAATTTNWCLCIFFSVDIEGATAYKVETRNQKDGDNDWCSLFESFYVDLPSRFFNEYAKKLSDNDATKGIRDPIRPILWKFVGDEILFYAPLTDSSQTLEHMRAFCQAIKNYNKELKEQGVKVRCKGTSWIAGFPINNRIVLIPNHEKTNIPDQTEDRNKFTIDFIGSSIDCGFRLTKFSSARKLVVSLDLLWMIAKSAEQYYDATCFEFVKSKIKYVGRHALKGVFSEKPYPIFWLDMNSEPSIEDRWINWDANLSCNCSDIIKFCEEFLLNGNTNDFIKPFIVNDPSTFFCTIPPAFTAQRQLLLDYRTKASNTNKQALIDSPQSSDREDTSFKTNLVRTISDVL